MPAHLDGHIVAPDEIKSHNGYPGKSITETIINGFFTVDHKWTVKYWNKAAEEILGVLAIDIVGKNLWKEFVVAIPLGFYQVYHKAFIQDIPTHFQEYWGEMGSWFDVITYYCDDTLSVSFKSSNHSLYPEHITNPEKQLRIVTELYRFVTEVTNDSLWEWDLQHEEIFWIDGGHKRAFGYQIENALIPQAFWENRLHPDDKPRVLAGLKKMIETQGYQWEDEYRFKKTNGQYAYVHDRGHIIYEGNTASRMIGATQDITSRRLTEMKLLESEKKLTAEIIARQEEKSYALLMANEDERLDIGRELHDNLNQILGATKLYIELAKSDKTNTQAYLEKSSGYITNVIDGIRNLSHSLASPSMTVGLVDSLEHLITEFSVDHPIKIELNKDDINGEELDEKMQINIFKIVREQLNNIARHSKATHAVISIIKLFDSMVLLVSDNGEGCDPSKVKNGFGNSNIRNRVAYYHGNVSIVSKPGQGYLLKVVFPLQDTLNL